MLNDAFKRKTIFDKTRDNIVGECVMDSIFSVIHVLHKKSWIKKYFPLLDGSNNHSQSHNSFDCVVIYVFKNTWFSYLYIILHNKLF